MRTAYRITTIAVIIIVLAAAAFAANVAAGMHAAAASRGTISGLALQAPVTIRRDARGVPHIRAQNEHDLFFADGYVQGADRLFQLDLLRRYIYGSLSEVLGSATLRDDEEARIVPVAQLVARQWMRLSARDKHALQAYADGVNAAMRREPLPVEFRLLMYRPQPWTPQDSMAVGFATILDLTDTWNDIAARSARRLPLTDPCYDAPVTAGLAHIADPKRCTNAMARTALLRTLLDTRPPVGSNEWAAGGAHTVSGRALLANDPHLRLQIPGVWYLVDMQSPGFHAAGASLAGTAGVILGHNDRVAWGATNGTVTSLSAYNGITPPATSPNWQTETFRVRFGNDVKKRYYRTRDAFGAQTFDRRFVLVKWPAYADPVSPLATFGGLDRAMSIEDALHVLRAYPGPTQNFALADTSGRVAYTLAGAIPNDPLWARHIHPAADFIKRYPLVPFDALPHVAPSRNAVVWTANNKMYGDGYPYQLSPQFAPPYRAYRIATLLRARRTYDTAYFARMQMDVYSIPERELAQYFPALREWDGRFTPESADATAAFMLRRQLVERHWDLQSGMLDARNDAANVTALHVPPSPQRWGIAGAVTVKHPLSALGLALLNGTTFAGNGDAYTVHVQNTGFSQSFRAVWDVGNWDAGGITIPQGESGEPGSRHYTDQAANWSAGALLALPYSEAAVARATVDVQTLHP